MSCRWVLQEEFKFGIIRMKNSDTFYGDVRTLHDKPLELCSPDVLSLKGEPLTGRRAWFTESHSVLVIFFFTYVLFIYFIFDIINGVLYPVITSLYSLTNSYATAFVLDC
jgi:hypothetical protein